MKKIKLLCFLIFSIFLSFDVSSKTKKVLEFTCEYDPNLIKKEQIDIGFIKDDNFDSLKICNTLSCRDKIEINLEGLKSNGKEEYRLRNSWFNHQGILLDDISIKDNEVRITTFVSQAFFLETYLIDRTNGKTKRSFYRFDNSKIYTTIKKLENDSTKNLPLYNSNGKLSLGTLKYYSLEPWEIVHFEGKCLEGTGI